MVRLRASNQVNSTVRDPEFGAVMAEVIVDVAGQEIGAAITRSSERRGLAEGRPVAVLIKATEVILGVDEA
jgi:molybdopterin-binding protein